MPDLIRSPDTRAWEGRSVFLGGSIEMGAAELWQPRVADRFLAAGISVLDPRRDSWDASLDQDPSPGTVFETQVNWELSRIGRADLVFFNLCAGTASVVSMLEIGLVIGQGRPLVIHAEEGYMRRGNIEVTARRYGVPVFSDEAEAVARAVTMVRRGSHG